jgi:hypothetical protein
LRVRRTLLLALPVSLAVASVRGTAFAQDSSVVTACNGQIVSAIDVTTRDPSFAAMPARLRRVARMVGLQSTTRESVVRRFVLVEPGSPCRERERAESERILRLQPFLADATVRPVPDGRGGVRVVVETFDEIPAVLSASLDGLRPEALTVGNRNVGGGGVYFAVRGERGRAYRDGASLQLVAHQALGRPYTFAVLADRAPLGSTLTVALGHAFLTDLQRTAWHAGYGDVRGYVSFVRREGPALSLSIERSFWNAGGVTRIGIRGRGAYFGGLLTHERASQGRDPVVITDSGLVADPDPALQGRFAPYSNVRLNAVLGMRFLRFTTVRGFDALSANQDIASGVQLGVLAGRAMRRLGSTEGDTFLSADLYAGTGSTHSLLAVRMEAEGRRVHDWDAIVGSGRIAWYRKVGGSHLLITSGEFSGGWRGRLPIQLMLGDRQGGVRGYRGSRSGGGQRAVVRLEERWTVGRIGRRADVGLATFVDAGKTWAGNVPFGVTSPVKTSVGLGLLAGVPLSRRVWRLDLTRPVSADADAKGWEVRLSSAWVRGFWREPNDVARVRAGAAPSTIFSWP